MIPPYEQLQAGSPILPTGSIKKGASGFREAPFFMEGYRTREGASRKGNAQ